MSDPIPIRVPRGRQLKRLETRNRIYEAAIAEFRERGFDQAQIEPIVERAGVARGTFYFHFPTKEHVLMELQRRMEAEVTARMLSGRRPESLRETLERLIEAIRHNAHEPLMRDMLSTYVRGAAPIDTATQPFIVEMIELFAEAIERGEVREDLVPEELVTQFGMQLFGAQLLRYGAESPEEAERFYANLIDIFVKGVAP